MRTQNDNPPVIDFDKLKHASYADYVATANRLGLSALGRATQFTANINDPESLAEMLTNSCMVQLFDVSALAPGDLKDKVLAFQEEVMAILKRAITDGMRFEGQRIGLMLEKHGHSAAASLVKATIV